MIKVKDEGEGRALRWGVYQDEKLIAAFVRERNADAYAMQLRRVLRRLK